MKIVLCGQFEDASGYGNAARNYLAAFDKNNIRNKIQFYIYNLSFESNNGSFLTNEEKTLNDKYKITEDIRKSLLESKDYILINFQVPHIPSNVLSNKNEKNLEYKSLLENARKNITMVVWETDTVPKMWKDCVYENIIVPCQWNYDTFKNGTQSNIFLLPYPLKKQTLKQYKKTNVFNILSISQWTHRKGFDTLLKAYCSEFFDNSDVCLTIKTYRNEIFNNNKQQERNFIIDDIVNYKSLVYDYDRPTNAKIKLISDILTKDQIDSLYDEADVFCLATRGEGFGLTIAEAASKGLPCIVPDKGGHIDFLDKNNNFLYESYYRTVINCRSLYSSKDMKYVETNIDDLRLKMRQSYDLWKLNKLHDMGKASKNNIDNYLDDVTITNKFIQIIEKVSNE